MNPKTSVWTCLPRHNSGLGHWSKIRPLLTIWFIFFLIFEICPKKVVLGQFFSFFGSKNSTEQNYELKPPPVHSFTVQVSKKRIFVCIFWPISYFSHFTPSKAIFFPFYSILAKLGKSRFAQVASKHPKFIIHCDANKGSHLLLTIISQRNSNRFSKTMRGFKRFFHDLQSDFCPIPLAQFVQKWQQFHFKTHFLLRRKV